jgi:hypothetical protein
MSAITTSGGASSEAARAGEGFRDVVEAATFLDWVRAVRW